MLEEPNLIPNIANPFDRDILPAALGTDSEILPFQSHGESEKQSDIYPSPHKD
jgi:hypothetical protein